VKKIARAVFLCIVLAALYLPVVILAVYSFTDSSQIGAIHHFSLQNYVTLFTTPELLRMIGGTLLLAFGSAAAATLLGTMGAIGAFYSKTAAKRAVSMMNEVPVVNADVVTGFSICILLVVVMNISKDTFIPLIVGHITLSAPFVYLAVMPKIEQMDPALYEAALDLGATPGVAMRRVVIPQIVPGIISGFGLAITLSLDDYFIATYTKPATFDTISTYVVNATKGSRTTIKTALWALSTVIFAVVVLAVVLMNVHRGKQPAMRKEDR
jgi:spermidine/putrescine transport system permease protein